MLPPAAPSMLPQEKIGRLALACPADVRSQSFDGRPATVDFTLPVATGGQAPVAVECTPGSGHTFSLGASDVVCNASDALQQTASCAFRVIVLGPPKLSVTKFVAFGDSLTAGWVSPEFGNAHPQPTSSYPYLLQRELQSRYVTQTIRIVNAGAPGEAAVEALSRFRSVVGSQRPDVVMLMQGTNDLDVVAGAGAAAAADELEAMVAYAQNTGADVVLMTIPPQLRTAAEDLVPPFNDMLRDIATRRRAMLVDVYDVLLRGACSGDRTTPCMGPDGLHPTAEGYRLIAQELARVIVEQYDVEVLSFPSGGHP